MSVKIRFFAKFRELLGAEIIADPGTGTPLTTVIREVAKKSRDGYSAIFDEDDSFREFVILMRNGKRLDTTDAGKTVVADGDEIAVFPPVAGG